MGDSDPAVVAKTFRALVDSADRKFARVRDLPVHGPRGFHHHHHYFQKVFKAYTRLWKFQQENRSPLVQAGLNRWEIGEIASRIGQLYYSQYLRTSEVRFLLESYIFYEAILNRGYFEGGGGSGKPKDLGLRYKELRFFARFLVVSLLLNRTETVITLVDRFRALVDDCRATFPPLFSLCSFEFSSGHRQLKLIVGSVSFASYHYVGRRCKLSGVRFPMVENFGFFCLPVPCLRTVESGLKLVLGWCAWFHSLILPACDLNGGIHTMWVVGEGDSSQSALDSLWELGTGGSSYKVAVDKWKQVAQEIVRFLKADAAFTNIRPLRYSVLFDSHQASLPYVARFHAKRVLKLKDAVLMSYHRNEVKCTELTLDTFRMLQCLEWEPSGSFYQMRTTESSNNGGPFADQSGLIDINLTADMTDPTLPPNPQKVIATICEELPPESSRGGGDLNNFYPGDLIPFTRRPLFLIIDSDNSLAFKAACRKRSKFATCQILHGAERGEKAALLLSPRKPTFQNPSAVDGMHQGSQFTFFLTAPLQAFCQLVGRSTADKDMNVQDEAENILSSSFSEWEVILCTSRNLDLVWAQVLSDPFLRRLILRYLILKNTSCGPKFSRVPEKHLFIFCRSILHLFHRLENGDQYLPECVPHLPDSVSPHSTSVETNVLRLTKCLGVDGHFNFTDDVKAVDKNV
ncbi:hypothetical protein ACLOJK_013465 [Asimina triloba]